MSISDSGQRAAGLFFARKILRATLAALLPVTALLPSVACSSAAPPGTRAMWVWGSPDADALIAFAHAHHVSDLYVNVAPTVASNGDLPRLRYLKSLADSAQIRLQALGGDPNWATDHANALAWQRAALGTGLFAGSHLDVEPYSLPEWNSTQPALVASYLSMLSKMQADSALPLEVDVPFWYGTIAAPGYASLADAVLARVDGVSVMSYRDTATGPNSMFDVSIDFLQRGAAAYKPVRLGAETNPLADCPRCTFYEEGETAMEQVLSAVDSAAASQVQYAGIAIEDYAGWSVLQGSAPPPPPPKVTPPPSPVIALSSDKSAARVGDTVTLSWSSQNAASCKASGAWAGSRTPNGSWSFKPAVRGSQTFTLSCANSANVTASKSVTVTVRRRR